MSTRGLLGLVIDGEVKATYNHSDSYPGWLGVQVVKAIDEGIDKRRARELVLVDENIPATPEQQAELADFSNTGVSTGDTSEWYVLLRELQGNLLGYLDNGYMIDGKDFAADSLFCEWGYLVNLDTDTLEVYKGFNKGVARGRFADAESDNRGGYGSIDLIAEIPFSELTVDAVVALENDDEDEDY